MKVMITAAASAMALAALIPAAASAQTASSGPSFYGTLGYDDTSLSHVNLGSVQTRLGARFGQYFGVEGEASWGVNDDSHSLAGGGSVTLKQDSQEALYGVGFLPVAPNFDLLARVGYGHASGTGPIAGVTSGVKGDSWNYGVGGQYMLDPKNGVRVDYTRESFQREGADDANVWALSYVRKF
jgi:outer membrane immunogenic protein